MPRNGWYDVASNNDNVTDANDVNGWATVSNGYGAQIANGTAYRFGPLVNGYGTWGQLIYANQHSLSGADLSTPSGLNGVMPANFAPDNSTWVQGHLVNGECGGDGATARNLTPISHNVNMLHASLEGTLQLLVNRGPMAGSQFIMFNPNGFPNTRLIYRTHALPPPAGVVAQLPNIPNGLCISLGIVINGAMMNLAQVTTELTQPYPNPNQRWFGNHFYTLAGTNDRARILGMVGGQSIQYP
jgi:hypothetical protein